MHKKSSLLKQLKNIYRRRQEGRFGMTPLNVVESFPAFAPNSAGSYRSKKNLTIDTIKHTIPCGETLLSALDLMPIKETPIESISLSTSEAQAAEKLKSVLDKHGSDKSSIHNYHLWYGKILAENAKISGILEVGMGSNNKNVVSNMGSKGLPGASLLAFKDWLPNAHILGADIDRSILFQEDRVSTFFVDQTKPQTFEAIRSNLTTPLDLVIDDGLHSPDANIRTLQFGLSVVKDGGWVVIEDIHNDAVPLWRILGSVLYPKYKTLLIKSRLSFLFAVQK